MATNTVTRARGAVKGGELGHVYPKSETADLEKALRAECERVRLAIRKGRPPTDEAYKALMGAGVPDAERDAQDAFRRMQAALRETLKSSAKVCGPCTAFVQKHRGTIEAFDALMSEKGGRWRQHGADRSLVARVVDVFAWNRVRIRKREDDAVPRSDLTNRDLACIAILYGEPSEGDSVAARIRSVEARVRAALHRA